MKPLVSINCTTFNHGKYIEEAIKSFLMQKTDFPFEILIHDDASTDNTVEIIERYSREYPEIIKPIIQEKNQQSQGVKKISYRFNHTRANGKYVAICEGDDYWTDPYKLQKQIDYMENEPNCTLCFHLADIINSEHEVKSVIKPHNSSQIVTMDDLIIKGGGYCPSSAIIYRKSTMDNAPELYFEAPVGDFPLQLITASHGFAYYMDDNMSIYRKIVKSGTSWSSMNKSKSSQIKLYEELNIMLQRFNDFSGNKYDDAVNKAIQYNQFYNVINRKQWMKFFEKSNRRFFRDLTAREKILVLIRMIMPSLYMKMLDYKYR